MHNVEYIKYIKHSSLVSDWIVPVPEARTGAGILIADDGDDYCPLFVLPHNTLLVNGWVPAWDGTSCFPGWHLLPFSDILPNKQLIYLVIVFLIKWRWI